MMVNKKGYREYQTDWIDYGLFGDWAYHYNDPAFKWLGYAILLK